jgi:hypothetical protein
VPQCQQSPMSRGEAGRMMDQLIAESVSGEGVVLRGEGEDGGVGG